MTVAEQKKAKILVVVVALAVLVWYFALQGGPPVPSTSRAAASPPANAKAAKLTGEGVIRDDLLDQDRSDGDPAGTTNLFQYRQRPEPPRPVQQQVYPPTPERVYQPPTPPIQPTSQLPQFKQFRYESVVKGATTGTLTAYLTDGSSNFPAWDVREGSFILGQYKVTRLTETMVEIEDTVNKRRQSFPKVTQ